MVHSAYGKIPLNYSKMIRTCLSLSICVNNDCTQDTMASITLFLTYNICILDKVSELIYIGICKLKT